MKRFFLMVSFAVALSPNWITGRAQDYPQRVIRLYTSGVGSGSDFQARLLAQGLTGPLGQSVVVENRPSGLISDEIVAKAAPDGYSLLYEGTSLWVGPLLQTTPFDAVKDFSPITIVGSAPSILVVHPSLQVRSVKELIALAKGKPGVLNYATASIGSPNHLGAEMFNTMAGVNIVRVNYKGTGDTITALLAGEEVHLLFGNITAVSPHVKSGKLVALAVTSAQPSTLAPGLPTMAASGLPEYRLASMPGVLAPAKTPPDIIRRLNQEIIRVLKNPDVRDKIFNAGLEVVGSTPDEFAALIKSEITTIGKLIKDAGIKVR